MATVSFQTKPKQATTTTTVVPEKPVQAVAVAASTNNSIALAQTPQLQGEFSARDMAIPYLNLGQKSGTMCDEHADWVGKWVYDKTICLGPEVRIVVCRLKKKYEEITEFGGAEIPQAFATAAEYREAGFSDTQVREVAEIDLLIECGDELEQFAMLDSDGAAYAPVRYVVRSSAYGRTVGILLKDLAGWLKNDLASGFYKMTTEKRQGNGNSWHVPKLTTDGKVSAALRDVIREKFGV